jgi:hypothetical protein
VFWSDLCVLQISFKCTWASVNTGQIILLWSKFPASHFGGPPFVKCPLLLVEYNGRCFPYLDVVFLMGIPWMHHAMVTMDPLTSSHFLTDCILFAYPVSPNRLALKVSIQLLGRYVCLCLPWPSFANRQERCQWRWFLTGERNAHSTQEEVFCNTAVTWDRLKRASLTSCEEWYRLE